MGVTNVRKWEYKGMLLEIKHIRHIEKERAEKMGLQDDSILNGHHCGYVSIKQRALTDEEVDALEVHGGITYGYGGGDANKDGTWTYGFDCAHYDDKASYWTAERVAQECEDLANQIFDYLNN